MDQARLAVAHGTFNVVTGLWPLVSMASFERVTGRKVDRWLVQTVGGLTAVNGLTQLAAASSPQGLRLARLLGMGTAGVLAGIDVIHGSRGRISRVYLADAVVELAFAAAWAAAAGDGRSIGSPRPR